MERRTQLVYSILNAYKIAFSLEAIYVSSWNTSYEDKQIGEFRKESTELFVTICGPNLPVKEIRIQIPECIEMKYIARAIHELNIKHNLKFADYIDREAIIKALMEDT